jgi:hypothetical protein
MWRLWNKIFGWHYIIVECGYNENVKNARVRKLGDKYYYHCNGKILLVSKAKYSNDAKNLPLTMSQAQFDKMIEINTEV